MWSELLLVYQIALAIGVLVAVGVYADLARRGVHDARRRGLVALGFGVIGLFIVPLVVHLRAIAAARDEGE